MVKHSALLLSATLLFGCEIYSAQSICGQGYDGGECFPATGATSGGSTSTTSAGTTTGGTIGTNTTSGSSNGTTTSGSTGSPSGSTSGNPNTTTSGASTTSGNPTSGNGTNGTATNGGATSAAAGSTTGSPLRNCAQPGSDPQPEPLTVSGSINVTGSFDAGSFVYVELTDFNGNPLLGTSEYVCTPGAYPYVLHGVPLSILGIDAGCTLSAWLDTAGVGTPLYGVEPVTSTTVSFATANAAQRDLSLGPLPTLPAAAGQMEAVQASNNSVLVLWTTAPDAGNMVTGTADHYQICLTWGVDAGECGLFEPPFGIFGLAAFRGAPAGDSLQVVEIPFLRGAAGPYIDAGVTPPPSSGGSPLTGTVSGAPPNVPVELLAINMGDNSDGGGLYFAEVPAGQSTFTFFDLPPPTRGAYAIYGYADLLGTGQLLPGDPLDIGVSESFTTCAPGIPDAGACPILITSGNAAASGTIQTTQAPEGLPNVQYQSNFAVVGASKQPVSVALLSSSDGVDLLDLPLNGQGLPGIFFGASLTPTVQLPSPPFTLQITYSDLTVEDRQVGNSSYFAGLPTPAVDGGNGVVIWNTALGDANPVVYTVGIAPSGSCDFVQATTTNGSYPLTNFSGVAIEILATDSMGNTAATGIGSSCYGQYGQFTESQTISGTVLYSGKASNTAPIYVTVSQGPNGPVLAGTTVTAAAPNFVIQSPMGGDTLTAWMDTLGTGHFVQVVDPYQIVNGNQTPVFTAGEQYATVNLSDSYGWTTPETPYEPPNELIAGDTGIMVMFDALFEADHLVVTAYPSDAGPLSGYPLDGGLLNGGYVGPAAASITVPSGAVPTALFAADAGLRPNVEYAFSYHSVLLGDAGPESYLSAPASFPATFVGTVVDGFVSAPNGLTVYLGSEDGFPFTSYAGGGFADYSIVAGSTGTQSAVMWAFLDLYGDGVIHPNTPGVLVYEPSPALWDGGSTAIGPLLNIPGGSVVCAVDTAAVTVDGGSPDTTVIFKVLSNFGVPMTAEVDTLWDGLLDLGVAPTSFVYSDSVFVPHQLVMTGQVDIGDTFPNAGPFTFNVVDSQGNPFSCNAPLQGPLSPINVSNIGSVLSYAPSGEYAVTFDWTPPAELANVPSDNFRVEAVFSLADGGFVYSDDFLVSSPTTEYPSGLSSGEYMFLTLTVSDNLGDTATTVTPFQLP